MVAHFSTQFLNEDGTWKNLTEQYNSASDISCTAGQMPRLVGLAQASKVFRENQLLKEWTNFSKNGDEIAWGTIGNASTSEGHFFEAINAAGVLQIPWLFPFGTMVMVFLYIVNIKQLKKIFLKF